MIDKYVLDPSQIERLREAGGPLAEQADLSLLAEKGSICVVEVDGRIVAYWVLFYALHAEPVWIAEDHRHSPAVGRALMQQLEHSLSLIDDPVAFAVIGDDTIVEQGAQYAERLGFAPVPGTLYYLVRQPAQRPEEP